MFTDHPRKTLFDITGLHGDKNIYLVSASEDLLLRTLLCLAYSKCPYTDDGELQDNETFPYIDFKRDPSDVIADKMRVRFNAGYGK